MFLALDIIVAVIFAATVIHCIRKGFLVSVLNLLKSLLAVVTAYLFSPALADFFKESFLSDAITVPVKNRLHVMLTETAGKFDLEKLFEDKPKEFIDILDRFGVKIEEFAHSYGANSQASEEYVASLARDITSPVVDTTAYILAFVALFLAALIALTIVVLVVSAIVKLPLIKGVDKMLGTVLGLVSGLILAVVLSSLAKVGFGALSSVDPDTFGGVIDKTVIVKFLGNLDLIELLVK